MTEATATLPENRVTITCLPAMTCPVSVPSGEAVGVAELSGVKVNVGVGDSAGVEEAVGVADSAGVEVNVGVAVSPGCEVDVAVSPGCEVEVAVSPGWEVGVAVSPGCDVAVGVSPGAGVEVAVGPLPVTVRFIPVDGREVNTLFPCETRTVHSMAVSPACKAVTLKVNAAPLVTALFPLLPAIAMMKTPGCGVFMATTASAPKRLVTTGVPTLTRLASKVQVNSALVYPSAGTLFKLTVTVAVPPTSTVVGFTTVDADGETSST